MELLPDFYDWLPSVHSMSQMGAAYMLAILAGLIYKIKITKPVKDSVKSKPLQK